MKMNAIVDQLNGIRARLMSGETERRFFSITSDALQKRHEIEAQFEEQHTHPSLEQAFWIRRAFYVVMPQRPELEKALFIKRCVLRELLDNLIRAFENKQRLILFVLVRPIIEHVAMTSSFLDDFKKIDVERIVDPIHKVDFDSGGTAEPAWEEIGPAMAKKLWSANADIVRLLQNDLQPNKQLPWRPQAGGADHKAEGLSAAIRDLSKKVEGVSRLYALSAEFAHPNAACWGAYLSGAVEKKMAGPEDIEVKGSVISMFDGGQILDQKIQESLPVIGSVLEHYFHIERELDVLSEKAQKQLRLMMRKDARNAKKRSMRPLFSPQEFCPCRSGKAFGVCCGKGIA